LCPVWRLSGAARPAADASPCRSPSWFAGLFVLLYAVVLGDFVFIAGQLIGVTLCVRLLWARRAATPPPAESEERFPEVAPDVAEEASRIHKLEKSSSGSGIHRVK
jgi:hypothetical protein